MNNVIEIIKSRRSIRKYKSVQIKKEELELIIEAGLYAPSGHNMQPWHFTVIQNKDLINEINISTIEELKKSSNEQVRLMANKEGLDIFYGAPTLIVISGSQEGVTVDQDCAAATQNMLLAAESLDIGSCWNGFVNSLFTSERKDEYIEKLKIPSGHTPFYIAAFGYKDIRPKNPLKRKENTVTYL